jgi:hypothetical protein
MTAGKAVVLGVSTPALMGAVIWLLFGSSSQSLELGRIVKHRSWGRTTSVDMYALGDAQPVDRLIFSWHEPALDGDLMTSCAAIPPVQWCDHNHDGRWDMWLYRTGPDASGECGVEYRVDTTGRGTPDWTFSLPFGQYHVARELIETRRGYF